jgi:hypothetical protein
VQKRGCRHHGVLGIPFREVRDKLEAKKKLTHTTNQNCVSLSFGEEEQKSSLVEGRCVERYVLVQAHEWER